MQLLWILPSLGYGIYLFATTGQGYGLIFGALSLVTSLGAFIAQKKNRPVELKEKVWFSSVNGNKMRVAIGNRVLPRWEWLWKSEWVDRVYSEIETLVTDRNAKITISQKLAGELTPTSSAAPGLSAWLGFASLKPVELDLAQEGFHGIILGSTGVGKSQLLTTWLISLAQGYSAQQLQFLLFDFKGGACLGQFSQLPNTAGFATDLDSNANNLLVQLSQELHRRERLLADAALGRIQELPDADRPPLLLTVVDEVVPLLQISGATQTLDSVAARGRSLGMHLIITGQSLTGIPRSLVTNLGAKFLVGKPDPLEMAQLGMSRMDAATEKHVTGWGVATMATGVRQVRFAFSSSGQLSASRLLPEKVESLFVPNSVDQPNKSAVKIVEETNPTAEISTSQSAETPQKTPPKFEFSLPF